MIDIFYNTSVEKAGLQKISDKASLSYSTKKTFWTSAVWLPTFLDVRYLNSYCSGFNVK